MQTGQNEKCVYVEPAVCVAAIYSEGIVAESQGDEGSTRKKQQTTTTGGTDTLGRYVSADEGRKKLWEE